MLAKGLTFDRAVSALRDVAERARRRMADGARILDTALTLSADAPRCICFLRGEGGLDQHFKEYEERTGGVEKVEIELLQDAVKQSAGMSVAAYAQRLTRQSDALRAIRDDENGIELTTVHRAKGRQWPTVTVFGCDEEQMPHKRSLEDLLAGNRRAGSRTPCRLRRAQACSAAAGRTDHHGQPLPLLRGSRARRGPSSDA